MTTSILPKDCEKYAHEIDNLITSQNVDVLEKVLKEIEQFSTIHNSYEYAPLFYYLGTGYSILAKNKQNNTLESTIGYRKKSLTNFRKAIESLEESGCFKEILLSAYTNYANELNWCGRVIEALRIYRKAILLYPKFGMALGNYGKTLCSYANTVTDSGHSKELHCYAYQAIKSSINLNDPYVYDDARKSFEILIQEYESVGDKEFLCKPIIFKQYSMGKSSEYKYRKWCLKNHLFLNPLNDLIEQESAFAHDPLSIICYTEKAGDDNGIEPPKWFAMLNQLKEQYIYARFLLFEGTQAIKNLHYADKDVKLTLSSYDGVNYSIRLEHIKSAFRLLYSIFDQVAFMVNYYWKFGKAETQADANNVFKSKKIKDYLKDNDALTALRWIHSEFDENESEHDLRKLRNAFEHKFVKIHDSVENTNIKMDEDNFYHISEDDLIKYTFRLLELSREFIMELVYAIGIEERKNCNSQEKILHLSIADFDDEWKI